LLVDTGYGRTGGAPEAPKISESPIQIPGVKTKQVKIRTGPYKVPGMNRQNPFSKHWGMLESYYDTNIQKPCEDCNILRQVGGLEYADGKNANIDSGLWYAQSYSKDETRQSNEMNGIGFTTWSTSMLVPAAGIP
jgi:hypothetical protein